MTSHLTVLDDFGADAPSWGVSRLQALAVQPAPRMRVETPASVSASGLR
jgi:hypothetical protein